MTTSVREELAEVIFVMFFQHKKKMRLSFVFEK
jgi:hypothetical protein